MSAALGDEDVKDLMNGNRGLLLNKKSSSAPIPIIYGEVRVGGTIAAKFSSGDDNYNLHRIIVLGEGEIDSVTEVYFDNELTSSAKYTINQDEWGTAVKQLTTGANEVILSGDLDPSDVDGDNGDNYIQRENGSTYLKGDYFLKSAGAWGEPVTNIIDAGYESSTVFTIVGAPRDSLGAAGDYVVRTDNPDYEGWLKSKQQGYVFHKVGDPQFSYTVHTGTTTQAADTYLVGEVSEWTTAHQLKGVAYIRVTNTLDFTRMVYRGEPNVQCVVRGRKLYDPRTTTAYWSQNPVLALRDYLTNTLYGVGLDVSVIDDTSFEAAANVCDIATGDPDATRNQFQINGVINPDVEFTENIRKILSSFNGVFIFSGGKYKVFAEVDIASSLDVDEDDFIGDMTISLGARSQLINKANIRFFNPLTDWMPDMFILDDATSRADEDNGVLLETDLNLSMTTNGHIANRLGLKVLKQSRRPLTVSARFTHKALKMELMDVVSVTHSTPGWEPKLFRVIKVKPRDDFTVDVVLREHNASVYNVTETQVFNSGPTTTLLDPTQVDPPTGLILESGNNYILRTTDGTIINRVRVRWSAPADYSIEQYEVRWKKSAEEFFVSHDVDGEILSSFVSGVDAGVDYDIHVRAINIFGAKSKWVVVEDYTVVEWTNAPPTPLNFLIGQNSAGERVFTWDPGTPVAVDHAGFRIYMAVGSSSDITEMELLSPDYLLSPYTTNLLAGSATYQFAIVAENTTGNQSTPAFISSALGRVDLDIATAPRDEKTLGFTGTKVSCSVNGDGNLVADSTGDWSTLANTWEALANTWDTLSASVSPITYTTPEIDLTGDRWMKPVVELTVSGAATITMQTGTDSDGIVTGDFTPLKWIKARYVKIKISVKGTTPGVSAMYIILDQSGVVVQRRDVNTETETSTWFESIAAGHFKLATDGGVVDIVSADITAIQGGGANSTWELISKSATIGLEPAAEFKVRNSNGDLIDTTVDAVLKGTRSA